MHNADAAPEAAEGTATPAPEARQPVDCGQPRALRAVLFWQRCAQALSQLPQHSLHLRHDLATLLQRNRTPLSRTTI
jgi:hypothetical protein